nr:hypothetical protein Iba_chr08cCG14100 [Ipomoea batatas]
MSAPENPWATTSGGRDRMGGDGGGSQKLSKKFEEGLEKTKAVASKSYKQLGGKEGHFSFMLAYGSNVLYSGSSIRYSPRIWQKGSLSPPLLHQLGRRVWLFS